MIDNNQQQQLADYFKTQPVAVAYLFGSHARGQQRAGSDLDIAVLFDESIAQPKRFDRRLRIIAECMSIVHRDDVEVIDLTAAPLALRYEAIKPRAYLYIADDTTRMLFEAETLSRYFDYSYYIKQNTHYSLASIARMDRRDRI